MKPDYASMRYRRCGRSGLLLPELSLGCWHNFGARADADEARRMLLRSFELGITHFDLANNYGPPGGSAEETVGRVLADDLDAHRDELIISTKAGFYMWPGPYGEWGSRKNLIASCDQSLQRLGLDYVDIFYHHRPDPNTPLDETLGALDYIVSSGRALYAGISNYPGLKASEAYRGLKSLGTPLLIHQASYSMLNRGLEADLTPHAEALGFGIIAFCPLQQGILTSKYLNGIPAESRAKDPDGFLKEEHVTEQVVAKVRQLNDLATQRGQSLAQMALQWVLRLPTVTSALIGARTVKQIEENVGTLQGAAFATEELDQIEAILRS